MKVNFTIFSVILIVIALVSGCSRDGDSKNSLQAPRFRSVEFIVEEKGGERRIFRPDTSQWLVPAKCLDLDGTIDGKGYSIQITYLGATPKFDRYGLLTSGAAFGLRDGESLGGDEKVFPFGEGGMLLRESPYIKLIIKVLNEN